MDKLKRTEEIYGFLWNRAKKTAPLMKYHFDKVKEVVNDPIVRGRIGIDFGSGCGQDTYIMAMNNPAIRIVSADLSDGVYKTKKITSGLNNVQILKCSLSEIPIKDDVFDFAYSYGVLHHTPSPKKSLQGIARIIKKNSPVFLYLYDDHAENKIKNMAIKVVSWMRRITTKIQPKLLFGICWIMSPFIFIAFSVPAKILSKFKISRGIAGNIPFNFGTGPLSLAADLYDRFSAPIEHRFCRSALMQLFNECGFSDISISKLKDTSGWVAWGYKK